MTQPLGSSATMGAVSALEYLELLARDAAPVEFERPVLNARAAGADPETIAELERAKVVALSIRGVLESRRRRETELSALFETAGDLAALNDVDSVLQAIVRRVRQLLHSDVSYMTLNDDRQGDTYMRVTDGITSAAFRELRLPMGAGLGGLVAQSANPYASADYGDDARFRHTGDIDGAVGEEGLVSIVGVPLVLGARVIGVLYAANRTLQPFGREAVALLESFAAHAAIAIDNARLLAETQVALAELEAASGLLRSRTESVERAADAHDRLTAIVARGGGVEDVAREVREVLGGEVLVVNDEFAVLAAAADDPEPRPDEKTLIVQSQSEGRTVDGDLGTAAPLVAGADVLGTLVLRRDEPVDEADRRILERAAMVTALLLLFRRSVAEAESRVRGELLEDLLSGVELDPASLRERAQLLGTDLDKPHAVVVAAVEGDRGRIGQAAAFLASRLLGFSAMHDGRLVVILPDLEAVEAARVVRDEIGRSQHRILTVGAAGPASGSAEIRTAHVEAGRCLDTLLALGRVGEVGRAEDLGFVGLLVGDRPDVAPFVKSVLAPVLGYDERRGTRLIGTLEAYFHHGGNLAKTSEALHVHVNTVTQRLERIGRLLGDDWQQPERQLEVQLALRLNRLMTRPTP